MWGLLGFLLLKFFSLIPPFRAKRSTAYLSTPVDFSLHNEREPGAIKDKSWIEGNVIMILQKYRKEIKHLDEYGKGNMQITKIPTLNKTCAMKKLSGGGNEHTCWR